MGSSLILMFNVIYEKSIVWTNWLIYFWNKIITFIVLGYYGGQPQGVPVPTNVPQGGYGFPSYSGYGQQNAAPPNQDN